MSLIWAQSHIFVEFDPVIVSTALLSTYSADSRRIVVSYKQNNVHEVLVSLSQACPAKEIWLGELIVST